MKLSQKISMFMCATVDQPSSDPSQETALKITLQSLMRRLLLLFMQSTSITADISLGWS